MKKRSIVVFERSELYTRGNPELDWRLVLGVLPAGSTPLAMANCDGFKVECGRHFDTEEVKQLAQGQSGYLAG